MAGPYAPQSSLLDHAAAFVPFSDGSTPEEVAAFFDTLGRIGPGLSAHLARARSMGSLFRSVFSLSMLAELAQVNQANCAALNQLGQDVLVLLDTAGRRGMEVPGVELEALATCFEDICSTVDAFCLPGWLLRLACDERLKDEFHTLHEAVLELVKGLQLAGLPGARPLPRASYANLCRPLRRLLKQLGRGSLSAGVACLRAQEHARVEASRLLGVPPEAIAAELEQIPESPLDLDTLYRQLVAPQAQAHAAGGSAAADAQAAPEGLYADLFAWYDANRSGALEPNELQAVLADLGMLDGTPPAEAGAITASHLRTADAGAAARGKGLGFGPFCKLYDALVMGRARQRLRFKLGLQVEEDLRAAFIAFASFGSREPAAEMDGARWQKLCRDCGLMGSGASATEADLVFAQSKAKGTRRVSFEQFLDALARLAERTGVPFDECIGSVLQAGGPVAHATQPVCVRLHDDKGSYTGVYARGGPQAVDLAQHCDLATLVDRSARDASSRAHRTTPKSGAKRSPALPSPHTSSLSIGRNHSSSAGMLTPFGQGTPGAGGGAPDSSRRSSLAHSKAPLFSPAATGPAGLAQVFAAFAGFGIHAPPTPGSGGRVGASGHCSGGAAGIDGFRFVKLCREAGLIDASFTTTAADIVFARVKAKGAKKISFAQFEAALGLIAAEKDVSKASLVAALEACGGPGFNSTLSATPDTLRAASAANC